MQSCSIRSSCVDNTHDTCYIAHRDVRHVEGSFNPVSGKADIEHKSNFENLCTGNSNTLAYTVNCIVFVIFPIILILLHMTYTSTKMCR